MCELRRGRASALRMVLPFGVIDMAKPAKKPATYVAKSVTALGRSATYKRCADQPDAQHGHLTLEQRRMEGSSAHAAAAIDRVARRSSGRRGCWRLVAGTACSTMQPSH